MSTAVAGTKRMSYPNPKRVNAYTQPTTDERRFVSAERVFKYATAIERESRDIA